MCGVPNHITVSPCPFMRLHEGDLLRLGHLQGIVEGKPVISFGEDFLLQIHFDYKPTVERLNRIEGDAIPFVGVMLFINEDTRKLSTVEVNDDGSQRVLFGTVVALNADFGYAEICPHHYEQV